MKKTEQLLREFAVKLIGMNARFMFSGMSEKRFLKQFDLLVKDYSEKIEEGVKYGKVEFGGE